MNKTYEISKNIHSNNGIYEAFYAEIVSPSFVRRTSDFGALQRIKKLYQTLTGAAAKRLAAVSGATLSILGIVGVAGGIQYGKISLLGGLLVTVACLGAEYLCLKSLEKSIK